MTVFAKTCRVFAKTHAKMHVFGMTCFCNDICKDSFLPVLTPLLFVLWAKDACLCPKQRREHVQYAYILKTCRSLQRHMQRCISLQRQQSREHVQIQKSPMYWKEPYVRLYQHIERCESLGSFAQTSLILQYRALLCMRLFCAKKPYCTRFFHKLRFSRDFVSTSSAESC